MANEHKKRCPALVVIGERMTNQSHDEAPPPSHSDGCEIMTGDGVTWWGCGEVWTLVAC